MSGSYLKPVIQAFLAGADLSAKQFTFVKFGADDKTIVGCGDDEDAIGVLMNAPAAAVGSLCEVCREGGAKLKLAGTSARGDSVRSGALGVAKTVTSGSADAVLDASGVVGDIVPCKLDRHIAN